MTPERPVQDVEQIKALLTLASDGLAAEVLDGTEQEKSAVTLGRLLGRGRVRLVLTCRGDERRYDWPMEWERAIADHARATGNGAEVTARREEASDSGPPRRETAPGKAPSLSNAAAAKPQVRSEDNAGGVS